MNYPETELDALLARYAEEIKIQVQMSQAQINRRSVAPNRTPRERFLWQRIEENLLNTVQHELDWVSRLRQDLQEQSFNKKDPF